MPFLAAIPGAFLAIGGAVSNIAFGVASAVGFSAGAATAIGASLGGFAAALGGAAGLGAALTAWGNVAAISSLLTSTPKIGAGGSSVAFKADPDAGIPYMMGRTATGGNIVFAQTSVEKNNRWLHYFVALSCACGSGSVESIDSFTANNRAVTFSAGPGYAATSTPYNDGPVMWLANQVGANPGVTLPPPTGTGTIPEWTSVHKASGMAMARWVLGFAADKYSTGTPKPLWVGHWVKVYDPRLDSTYPGGSGAHRADDETTWAWSENPGLHGLAWALGRRLNGILVLGIGAPASRIDVASFVELANVCDANSWTMGGGCSSKDSKWEVLKAILQAGGAVPVKLSGAISCVVTAPRVSLATLSEADLAGPCSRPREVSRRDKVNQIVPRFRSESHNWEMIAAAPVKVDGYITAEGRRSIGVDYVFVQDVTQVSQLAAYGIYDSHEVAPVSLPVRPRWMGLRPGDVFTLTSTTLGLSSQQLLVIDRRQNPQTLDYTLVCRFETPTKHTDALALTGEIPFVPFDPNVDPLYVAPPGADAWSVTASSYDSGGILFPKLVIDGASDNVNAALVAFDYESGTLSGEVFTGSGIVTTIDASDAPTTTHKEILNVTAGTAYQVRATYIDGRGVPSAATIIGIVTASLLTVPSGGTPPPATGSVVFESSTYGAWGYTASVDGDYSVEGWGGGGQGDPGSYSEVKGSYSYFPGPGGGGGAYFQETVTLTAGSSIGGSVGAGSAVAVDGGDTTLTSPACTASGGDGGSSGGAGGTATGGTTNTAGDSGSAISLTDGGGAGSGGGDQTTANAPGTVPGGGGAGGDGTGSYGLGRNGRIRVTLVA